jgi:hypothetical protein
MRPVAVLYQELVLTEFLVLLLQERLHLEVPFQHQVLVRPVLLLLDLLDQHPLLQV